MEKSDEELLEKVLENKSSQSMIETHKRATITPQRKRGQLPAGHSPCLKRLSIRAIRMSSDTSSNVCAKKRSLSPAA